MRKMRKQRRRLAEEWLTAVISERRKQLAIALTPGKVRAETEQELAHALWKQLRLIVPVSLLLLLVAIYLGKQGEETQEVLERPSGAAGAVAYPLVAEGPEGNHEIVISVQPRDYPEEELELLQAQAEIYLDSVVLAKNTAWSSVESALFFPETIFGEYPIEWSTDALWLVEADGTVNNASLQGEEQVLLRGQITYGSEFRVYERMLTVRPKVYTQEEQLLRQIEEELKQLEYESRMSEKIAIPERVLGWQIKQSGTEKAATPVFLTCVAIALPILTYYAFFERLEQKRKQRVLQAQKMYSEFITKLTLLFVAGLSIRQAMVRLAREYTKNYGTSHVLAQELMVTTREIENGRSEQEAYEALGSRIGLPSYRRMASLLAQSVSRGVKDIGELLLFEAKEVTAQESAEIKIRGEQAGTKLIAPMMGFLILIFAILLVPAFRMF